MSTPSTYSDIERLCALLFLQEQKCRDNSKMFFAVVSKIIDVPIVDVLQSAERLKDLTLENRNVDLFYRYKAGTLGDDVLDFKVMLCVAFAGKIDMRDIVGDYALDVLTVITDMPKERVNQAIVDAEKQGLIELPKSKGSA